MPGSYQVTPAILGRRRATQRITVTPASKPGRPTASYRVSPPPARGPTSRVGRHRPSARDPDTEASYPGRPAGRGQPFASRFPAAFRPPAFASRSSDSRRGIRPSSRLAYRARPSARTPTGVTAFRTHELRPGVGAPYNPRTMVLARPGRLPDRHPPLPSGQSLNPATTSHHARLSFTGHQQGFTHVHPSGLPLARAPGGGTGSASAFP